MNEAYSSNHQTHYLLQQLFHVMRYGSQGVANPCYLMRHLQSTSNTMKFGQQQDAYEFYHLITLTLNNHSASFELDKLRIPRSVNEFLVGSVLECTECGYKSPIRCNVESALSLIIPLVSKISIEELLDTHFRSERIDDYVCWRCTTLKSIESSTNQLGILKEMHALSNTKGSTLKRKRKRDKNKNKTTIEMKMETLKISIRDAQTIIRNNDPDVEIVIFNIHPFLHYLLFSLYTGHK